MKKTLLALSVACASAFAFGDSAQWTSSWIKGIGANATAIDSLDTTGGSWSDGLSSVATFANKTLTIETDEEIAFTVSSDAAATAKTAQKITVKGVFAPCSASDLATGAEMNTKGAQIGFAVVSGTGENSTTIYTYYAWVGKTDGSTAANGTAIDDWVSLGTCANSEKETDLTVELSYWGGTPKATFSIKNNGTAVTIADATKTLTSTAAAGEKATLKVGSVACTGSGTLTALDGVTGVAVATVDDVPYATVDDAIAAAKTNGGTVEVVVAPSGNVDEGKEGTVDATKECVVTKEGGITVQTKTSILEAITFNDVALKANVSALRTFLSENCNSVYTGTDSTTAKLQTALENTPEGAANKLALWQDYALGIKPSTKLEMGYATDLATDGVTVKLATTVAPSGDYKITYKCVQVDGNAAAVVSSDAGAIKLPLTTGRYKVNVVFSAPAAEASGDDSEEVQN